MFELPRLLLQNRKPSADTEDMCRDAEWVNFDDYYCSTSTAIMVDRAMTGYTYCYDIPT